MSASERSGSHTILSESISGAAVYVGMTRGRGENALYVVAENLTEARELFIEAMEPDRADCGLADVTERAAEAVRGLVDDGPAKLVYTRIAQLTRAAKKAEAASAWWQQAGARLDQQRADQQAESDTQAAKIQAATDAVELVHADVLAPLVTLAQQEGADHLAALDREAAAQHRLNTVERLGRRAAR